jgi:deazaflavin-dependent oxidoreductase (nitroreductase family)
MNPLFGLFVKAHVWLYKSSGGKLGTKVAGLPVLLLTTRGRRSGAERTVPLVPFLDGDQIYIMASMGGQPQHPAWFFNLEANPEVEVQIGPTRWHTRAEVLPLDERTTIWPRIATAMPNFGQYQKRTPRVIPVIRLPRRA